MKWLTDWHDWQLVVMVVLSCWPSSQHPERQIHEQKCNCNVRFYAWHKTCLVLFYLFFQVEENAVLRDTAWVSFGGNTILTKYSVKTVTVSLIRFFDVFFVIRTAYLSQPRTKIFIHDLAYTCFFFPALGPSFIFLLQILIGLLCYWLDCVDSFSRVLATVKTLLNPFTVVICESISYSGLIDWSVAYLPLSWVCFAFLFSRQVLILLRFFSTETAEMFPKNVVSV